MSAHFAVSIADNQIDIAVAIRRDSGFLIDRSLSIDLERIRIDSAYANDEVQIGDGSDTSSFSPIDAELKHRALVSETLQRNLEALEQHYSEKDLSFELVGVLITSTNVFYHRLNLPFKEPKRLDQIVPLQLQDLLPFDLDGFLIHNLATAELQQTETTSEEKQPSSFRIISALDLLSDVDQVLEIFQAIELEPKVVTTRASALAQLPEALALATGVDFSGPMLWVYQDETTLSLAMFDHHGLLDLREANIGELSTAEISSHFLCTLEAFRYELQTRQVKIYTNNSIRHLFTRHLQKLELDIEPVDLSIFLGENARVHHPANDLYWAISLFHQEFAGVNKNKKNSLPRYAQTPMVNFRVGPFAYHPAFENILSAAKDELFWYLAAVCCLVFWGYVQYYVGEKHLATLNKEMQKNIALVFDQESAPANQEISFVEDRLLQLEDQLRGLGSLSSLSPLESLKELSDTINQGIDLQIDSLNIGYSRMTFRGTAADNPTVGQLDGALKRNKKSFCSPKADPAGREPGTTRVKYSAELEFCE